MISACDIDIKFRVSQATFGHHPRGPVVICKEMRSYLKNLIISLVYLSFIPSSESKTWALITAGSSTWDNYRHQVKLNDFEYKLYLFKCLSWVYAKCDYSLQFFKVIQHLILLH